MCCVHGLLSAVAEVLQPCVHVRRRCDLPSFSALVSALQNHHAHSVASPLCPSLLLPCAPWNGMLTCWCLIIHADVTMRWSSRCTLASIFIGVVVYGFVLLRVLLYAFAVEYITQLVAACTRRHIS